MVHSSTAYLAARADRRPARGERPSGRGNGSCLSLERPGRAADRSSVCRRISHARRCKTSSSLARCAFAATAVVSPGGGLLGASGGETGRRSTCSTRSESGRRPSANREVNLATDRTTPLAMQVARGQLATLEWTGLFDSELRAAGPRGGPLHAPALRAGQDPRCLRPRPGLQPEGLGANDQRAPEHPGDRLALSILDVHLPDRPADPHLGGAVARVAREGARNASIQAIPTRPSIGWFWSATAWGASFPR